MKGGHNSKVTATSHNSAPVSIVTAALKHALTEQRLHHAYLFTGTRGVGKTSIARLFAKCLNCEAGISPSPCEQCTSCQEIAQGRFIDLIEVDAASRTKVEDTRDLLDNVQYAPTRGRYKIYLIDEVHMLSNHSFNALLKTLEEPPEHVIFLLATTDPQKLPITVLSRCLQLPLKNMTQAAISQQLADILQKEAIPFELAALNPLAQAANGSMRDALSLLDQAIAHGQGQIQADKVLAMLGCIDNRYILDLLRAIAENAAENVLALCQAMTELAADFRQVTQALLHSLTEIALLQAVPHAQLSSPDQEEQLKALAKTLSKEEVQLYYQIALLGLRDLSYAPSTTSGFTMLMLRMLSFRPSTNTASTMPANTAAAIAQTKAMPVSPAPIPVQATPVPSSKPITAPDNEALSWEHIISQLPLVGALRILAENCVLNHWSENRLSLSLDSQQAPLLSDKTKERLQDLLSEHFKKSISLEVRIAQQIIDSPANLAKKTSENHRQNAKEKIEKDSAVQAILQQFNATINTSTIKSNDE